MCACICRVWFFICEHVCILVYIRVVYVSCVYTDEVPCMLPSCKQIPFYILFAKLVHMSDLAAPSCRHANMAVSCMEKHAMKSAVDVCDVHLSFIHMCTRRQVIAIICICAYELLR